MSVGLESLPLAETTPDSHLVNPSASDNTEDIGLIIMLCLTIGIIFGLIGLTIWMTKNRNVRYTILAKLMSLFIFLEQISCKNERHNMERYLYTYNYTTYINFPLNISDHGVH